MKRNRVLKSRTSNPVFRILAKTSKFDAVELMKFYNNWECMFKQQIQYGDIKQSLKICLILTNKDGPLQWNFFGNESFVKKLREGKFQNANAIMIRCNGDVLEVMGTYINDAVEASSLSKKVREFPVIFIDNRMIHFFVDGEVVHFIIDILDERRIGLISKRCLQAREYRRLMENHYSEAVDGERGLKYWSDKSMRLFLPCPEIIFNKSLWYYLNYHVVNGKVDSGVDIGGTSDRTDIRILSFEKDEEGQIYIIEIKCLGKCKISGPEKGDNWANQGIIQLGEYLNEEENSKVGVLVVYDGRRKDDKIAWIPRRNWHKKIDSNPMIFFLISEPASIRAKQKLKAFKVK